MMRATPPPPERCTIEQCGDWVREHPGRMTPKERKVWITARYEILCKRVLRYRRPSHQLNLDCSEMYRIAKQSGCEAEAIEKIQIIEIEMGARLRALAPWRPDVYSPTPALRANDDRKLIRESRVFESTAGPPRDKKKAPLGVTAGLDPSGEIRVIGTGKSQTNKTHPDFPENPSCAQPRFFAARRSAPSWPAKSRARAPP